MRIVVSTEVSTSSNSGDCDPKVTVVAEDGIMSFLTVGAMKPGTGEPDVPSEPTLVTVTVDPLRTNCSGICTSSLLPVYSKAVAVLRLMEYTIPSISTFAAAGRAEPNMKIRLKNHFNFKFFISICFIIDNSFFDRTTAL